MLSYIMSLSLPQKMVIVERRKILNISLVSLGITIKEGKNNKALRTQIAELNKDDKSTK